MREVRDWAVPKPTCHVPIDEVGCSGLGNPDAWLCTRYYYPNMPNSVWVLPRHDRRKAQVGSGHSVDAVNNGLPAVLLRPLPIQPIAYGVGVVLVPEGSDFTLGSFRVCDVPVRNLTGHVPGDVPEEDVAEGVPSSRRIAWVALHTELLHHS